MKAGGRGRISECSNFIWQKKKINVPNLMADVETFHQKQKEVKLPATKLVKE